VSPRSEGVGANSLGEVGEESCIVEAVVVHIAADDVVENADAQNYSGFDKSRWSALTLRELAR